MGIDINIDININLNINIEMLKCYPSFTPGIKQWPFLASFFFISTLFLLLGRHSTNY